MEHDALEGVDGTAHRDLALGRAVDVVEHGARRPPARTTPEVVGRHHPRPRVAAQAERRRDEPPKVGNGWKSALHGVEEETTSDDSEALPLDDRLKA